MVKNWIILGDAALENADWTLGVIDFTQSEIANWKDIALERIKAAKTERITQFAKEGGTIDISGLFYVKNRITPSDFDDFCNQVAELFGVELLQHDLSSSSRREDNKIFITLSRIPMKGALDILMPENENQTNGKYNFTHFFLSPSNTFCSSHVVPLQSKTKNRTIMVKNWIVFCDYNIASDGVYGVTLYKNETTPRWTDMALEIIKSGLSERLLNDAKERGQVDLSGVFNKRCKVSQSEFYKFCVSVAELFNVPLGVHVFKKVKRRKNNGLVIFCSHLK